MIEPKGSFAEAQAEVREREVESERESERERKGEMIALDGEGALREPEMNAGILEWQNGVLGVAFWFSGRFGCSVASWVWNNSVSESVFAYIFLEWQTAGPLSCPLRAIERFRFSTMTVIERLGSNYVMKELEGGSPRQGSGALSKWTKICSFFPSKRDL